MKLALVIAAFFAVCSSGRALDWKRANSLLREFRDFEAFEELERRGSERKCNADVVFIVDRSRSIESQDFEKGKEFLQDLVRRFNPANSRFAVISFATGATNDFSLNTYGHDMGRTLSALGKLDHRQSQSGDQTEPWAALDILMRDYGSLPTNEMPIVLLITDGASQDWARTTRTSKRAHDMGFKIYAIGVGKRIKMSELHDIASRADNVKMVADYSNSLRAIEKDVVADICDQNIENCEHKKPLDVMFSVSEHANAKEAEHTFNLIHAVMEKATIGPDNIQFGLARRDCGTTWAPISLNEMDTVEGFKAEFDSRLRSFRNSLTLRLSYLARDAFKQGDQPSANNVAVVFIDRKSDIDSTVTTRASQMNGVHVIVMAGGDVTESDVRSISSDVIHFRSYDQLMAEADDLLTKLCEALARP